MTIWSGFGDVLQFGWSAVSGWSGDKVLEGVQGAIRGFVLNMLTGVAWVMTMIGKAMSGLEGSGIGADWYIDRAFAPMQVIGVSLAVLALTWGIVSAAWSRKGWVVLKRMSIQMIKWMFLTFFCLQGTQMLLDLTAEFESFLLLGATGTNATNLFDAYGQLGQVAPDGDAFSAVLILVISLLMMLAGIGILLVLFVRDAALMLVLLFAPVVALLLLTPHAKAVGKFINKVIALVLLKFVIMVGLILGSSAILATTGVGNTFAAAPPPSEPSTQPAPMEEELAVAQETYATDEAEAVGTMIVQLLSGLAVMVMSLIMPAFIASVLPDGIGDPGIQAPVGRAMQKGAAKHEQRRSVQRVARATSAGKA